MSLSRGPVAFEFVVDGVVSRVNGPQGRFQKGAVSMYVCGRAWCGCVVPVEGRCLHVDGRDRDTALRQLFWTFRGWCVRCGGRPCGSVIVECMERHRGSRSFNMVCKRE